MEATSAPRMGCSGCPLGFVQGGASVCRDELDLARGSPWLCLPHIRSLMGATTLLEWGFGTCCCLGGCQRWGGGGCSTACACKVWGGEGRGQGWCPQPPLTTDSPAETQLWPHSTVQGQDGAQWGCCCPSALGMESRMIPGGHPLTPRKAKRARQRAAPVGFASPCSPALSLLPALGLASWAGAWHGAEGLAGGRTAPPPPSLLAAEELKTQPL